MQCPREDHKELQKQKYHQPTKKFMNMNRYFLELSGKGRLERLLKKEPRTSRNRIRGNNARKKVEKYFYFFTTLI